jgi:hypothetical protein
MHYLSQRKNAQVGQESLVPIAIVVPYAGHRIDKDGNSGNALQLRVAARCTLWSPGRSPIYWGGTTVTGDIHARATDHKATRNAGNLIMYSNRITNQADARRILAKWAGLLRDRLDEFHGK